MEFHILTLFPDMMMEGLHTSILGKASERGHIRMRAVNIRDYTQDKHKKVDDYPYGGGAGMLMQAQPVYDAYQAVRQEIGTDARVVYVTPQGKVFSQKMAEELAKEEHLVFLCGHYEGVDERVLEEIVTDYVSIGDYVLTGGELPAMVMIDAVSRLVPGVLNNEESAEFESFHGNLLEYPQYTRPEEWHGKKVPEVLLGGNHAKVDAWRREQAELRTKERRPDLYEGYDPEGRAISYLKQDRLHHMDMLECIRRGRAEILGVRGDGVLLRERRSGVYMLTAETRDAGERLLSLLPEGEHPVIVSHQEFMNESICARFDSRTGGACRQVCYTRKQPFALQMEEGISLKTLDTSYAEVLLENYALIDSLEEAKEHLEWGVVYGVFVEGKLAGFVGEHGEGSMGMLQVFEPYRRRGLAELLEKDLLNRQIARGFTPYCQIFEDNRASFALQEKLGLKVSKGRIWWIG